QFMHDAVDWKIIDENPFSKVRTQRSTVKVNEFVPREVVDKLMKKANPVWKVILGLSRYGGLRTPNLDFESGIQQRRAIRTEKLTIVWAKILQKSASF
ncbi:MAG: hypothetical protein ACK480_09690, partial [Planctomycetota bacterium]